jgi:hypothetical protein
MASKMRMKNVTLTRDAKQVAVNTPAEMDMEDVSGRDASQIIRYEDVDLNDLAFELKRVLAAVKEKHPEATSDAAILTLNLLKQELRRLSTMSK